jgi:ligand-binding sensor domain-containing protein
MLFCQVYPLREYTVADGLPQSQSTGIFQDSRGFLWIKSRNGVSCFDGIEFKSFFRKDGLPGNSVNQITENSSGIIYALSNEGISVFDGQKFFFHQLPEKFRNYVVSYGVQADSFLVLCFNPLNKRKVLLSFENSSYNSYSELIPSLDSMDIQQQVYDSLRKELVIRSAKGRLYSFKNNKLLKIPGKGYENLTWYMNKIYIESNEGIFEYEDGYLRPFVNNIMMPGPVLSVEEGKNYLFRLKDSDDELSIKLQKGSVIEGLLDFNHTLWLSGEKNIYRLVSKAFRRLSFETLPESSIWSLAVDKNGKLWIGSLYGDLQEYDGYLFKTRNEYKTLVPPKSGFYKGSRMMSNGDIYFAMNTGVLIWNGEKFSRMKIIPENAQVCYIYEDPIDKSVLFGTGIGLYRLKDGKLKYYPEFNDDKYGVIEGIVRDSSERYWLSGHRGMILFDISNNKHVADTLWPETLTYTLEKDKNGGLWVTSDEGLLYKAGNSNEFRLALPRVANKPANSIIMMDSLNLLVGRSGDLCIIDLDKFYKKEPGFFRIYDKTDGFSGDDCLDNGIIRDKDGKYIILTSDGLDILDPKYLKKNNIPPKINLVSIEAATDSNTWDMVNKPGLFYGQPEEIVLARNQKRFRIRYTGISSPNPEKVSYQCRLIGYDDIWKNRNSVRTAVYEKIPPGRYRFELRATNADGVSATKTFPVIITIKPAWWQRIIFRLLFILILLGISAIVTWLIMKEKHRKKAEKEKLQSRLSQLYLASALKQFDPHFTFNVLSSVGSLIMNGEKETAYEYLLKLSGLLRSVLNDGNAIIKPLSEELDFVSKYCEVQKMRFGDRIDWKIDVGRGVNLDRKIPKMTIQIFVENAIKHGLENKKEGGRLDIKLSENEAEIIIIVRDNGVGREAAARTSRGGSGNGLRIICELFEQINKRNISKAVIEIIDLKDGNTPLGTEVKIRMPHSYDFGISKTEEEIQYGK